MKILHTQDSGIAPYFFTVTLKNRQSSLLIDHIDLLKACIQKVKQEHPYTIKAFVILPDHTHALWELPENDADYSLRWRKIKSYFTVILKAKHNQHSAWQSRFWEHTIRDDYDLETHINYIHYNPVKHGLVNQVSDWCYSSFHYYVRQKIFPINWGSAFSENGKNTYGE